MTKNEIIERLTSIYESMLINDEYNEAINQAIDILADLPDRYFGRKETQGNG